ncbi:uncharacterized protein DS421_13g413650 [Arachis hypogaea]|nr:uncharacterized protein DS421_13g413650 [Arachis hypogaea]
MPRHHPALLRTAASLSHPVLLPLSSEEDRDARRGGAVTNLASVAANHEPEREGDIAASFVGSLPPNPFLPPPLESQTGEVTVEALPRRSDRQKPPVEPLSSWAELWFLHAEFSSRACDIKLSRRQRSRRRSVFPNTHRFEFGSYLPRLKLLWLRLCCCEL